MTCNMPLRAEMLYEFLEAHIDDSGEYTGHLLELAELCGMSGTSVRRAVADLTQNGFISAETIPYESNKSIIYHKFKIRKKLYD